MQHFLRSIIFLFLIVASQLLGCSESTDNNTADGMDTKVVETVITEPAQTKPTPEDTFEKLKTLFPKPIFDAEFTTLGEVTTAKTYLDFLTQEYRTEKPFKTLAAYLDVAQPDPERYTPFLKEFIKNPNEKDIAIMHQITLQFRCANALQYQMLLGGNVLEAIFAVLEKKLGILNEKNVKAWRKLHFPEEHFVSTIDDFVRETERTDTLFIQEQFEKHGKNDGILWVALRNPALTAEILNNFTNTDAFLKWINGDFFIEEP